VFQNLKYNSLKASLSSKKSDSIPKSLRTKYNLINKRIQIEDRLSNIDLIQFSLGSLSSSSGPLVTESANIISKKSSNLKKTPTSENKKQEDESSSGSSSSDSNSSDSDNETQAQVQQNRTINRPANRNTQTQVKNQQRAQSQPKSEQQKKQDINQRVYNLFFDNNHRGVVDSFLENFAHNQNSNEAIKIETVKYLSRSITELVTFQFYLSIISNNVI
jgi:hypothetical protein